MHHSSRKTFTIPLGADGSAVAPLNFTKPYKVFRVMCSDTTGIQAATEMIALTSPDVGMTPAILHNQDDPGTPWAITLSGQASFDFAITHAFGDILIQFILSQVTTAAVTLYVWGYN